MWNPDVYLAFADHRGRPFFDLTARVGGRRRRDASSTWVVAPAISPSRSRSGGPTRCVEAVDSSQEMVAAARERGLDAVVGDHRRVVTQAGHRRGDLATRRCSGCPSTPSCWSGWADELPAGAWIAMQVPGNFNAPSHVAVREVAAPRAVRGCVAGHAIAGRRRRRTPRRATPDLLTDAGCAVDAWETTYVHQLTGETPVLDWITGTALTQVKSRLSRAGLAAVPQAIIPMLAEAYPARADGTTFFPFRRIFVVARVGG